MSQSKLVIDIMYMILLLVVFVGYGLLLDWVCMNSNFSWTFVRSPLATGLVLYNCIEQSKQ